MDTLADTVKYRGHTIEIHYDEWGVNPFEDWDYLPDIIIHSDRYFNNYGNTDHVYLPDLTEQEIKKGVKAILEETETRTLLNFINEYTSPYVSIYSNAIEAVNDTLQEYYSDLHDSDKLSFLGFIYKLKGVIVLNTSVTGYSQGDYAELLIIASDSLDSPEGLQSYADLYGSWAYGDVYMYDIKETEDSFGDFYGSDHDQSGLLEAAKNSIDCSIKWAEKERITKLKALIKSHAPLYVRQAILSK